MKLLNIYGPYNNRVDFWENLENTSLIRKENLIIRGDLNFTLGAHEIWVPRVRLDTLSPFFGNLLHNLKLVDLDPQKLKPTWTNRRMGEDWIAKWLDRFLMAENLLEKYLMFKQWVYS